MKLRSCCVLLLLSLPPSWAFDPSGAPPVWTMTNTCTHLAKSIRPQAQFSATTAPEILELLRMAQPAAYCPAYELDELLSTSNKTFEIDRKNVTDLEILSWLAGQLDAELVIQPGKVRLQKRGLTATKPSS